MKVQKPLPALLLWYFPCFFLLFALHFPSPLIKKKERNEKRKTKEKGKEKKAKVQERKKMSS